MFSGENAIDPDLISDYDAARAHLVRREQRLKGSCEWLFATKEYKQWNGGRSSPLLVCAGPVGCGKSIIASAVIDRLEEVAVESTTITYYVDANVNKPTTAVDIIRAFVKHLVLSRQSSRSPIQSDLRKTIDATFAELRRPPSLISTTQILLGVIRDAPVSVVVDGLDAMDEHEILSFLHFLRDLMKCTKMSGSRLRLALFCRGTLGRNISLEVVPGTTVLRIDVVHLRQDIYAYIGHEVEHQQLARPITTNRELLEEIKEILGQNSKRI